MTIRVIGAMPSPAFVDRLMDAYRKIDRPWLYDRLFDFRQFTGMLDYGDLEHLARKWGYLTRDVAYSSKVATITHDPFDRARVSTMKHLFPQDVMRAFPALDEALDWLEAP